MSLKRIMIVLCVLHYHILEKAAAKTLTAESTTLRMSSSSLASVGSGPPDYLPLQQQVVATQVHMSHSDEDEYSEIEKFKSFVFEYKYGKRVYGDELIICDTKAFTFPIQDVSLQLQYPKENDNLKLEYTITHFRLFVKQDSPISQGMMAQGSEDERELTLGIIITAGRARRLTFSIRIYGVPLNMD